MKCMLENHSTHPSKEKTSSLPSSTKDLSFATQLSSTKMAIHASNGYGIALDILPIKNDDKSKTPTTQIPIGTDAQDRGAKGHGTHTTGIAAGSDVGNGQYGVAPEADIIMIPSTFLDTEVLEDVQFLKTKAKLQQQPWVVNMSFGSQEGPHDGSRPYDQKMSKLGGEKGGILVASAGNHGDMNIHVKSTIPVSQTRYLFFDFRNNKPLKEEDRKKKMLIFDIWTQSTDGIDRLEVKPFLLINNKIDFMDEPFWKKYGWFEDNQSQETKKIETKIWMRLPLIRHEKKRFNHSLRSEIN